jgi:hypothetical protein
MGLEKMFGFVSNGAPAAIGKNDGVAAKKLRNMKERFLSLFSALHLNMEHSDRSLKMNHLMDTIIEIVNFMLTIAFNCRDFVALFEEV